MSNSNNVGVTQTTNILPVQALYDPLTLAFITFIGPAGLPFTSAAGGVSSVQVSGGTTGLTYSGGPIVSSGTITMAGTLSVSNGGTGATSNTGALTNLLPTQAGNTGYFLKTDGTNVSWAQGGSGLTIATDNTTNANLYVAFTSATSGVITTQNVSTNLKYNPSSNTLTATTFVGALTGNASTATSATTATNIAGGSSGALVYQSASGTTTFLTAGTNGQYLTLASGVPSWTNLTPVSSFSAGTTGFTPSTATTGAVTLAGTLNTANGGTGNTTGTAVNVANAVTFNNSGTGVASGTTFDGSTARTVSYNTLGASPLAGSTSLVTLGTVTTGTWNATAIGAIYGGTGLTTYTTGDTLYASATNTLSKLAVGSTGQVLTVAGGVPTWANTTAATTITDDTTTASTRYINFTSATSGSLSTIYTSSTKLQYNPSTGLLTSTGFSGSGASLTSLNASNISSGTVGTSYISGSYTGITGVGTLTAGTWNGSLITGTYGGTGVNNGSNTITIAGNVTHSGAFTQTFTATANTSVTLPTSGTLLNTTGSGASLTFTTGSLSLAGNLTTSGAFATTLTATATTNVTLPTTGTLATLAGSETFTNKTLTNPTVTNYVETLYAPAAGSAFTISLANGTVQELSLNANGTLTLPSSVAGKSFTIIVTYSGAYSLTWAGGGTLKWAGGTTPTATSVSGKYDIFNFYQDGTNTYGSVYGLNY